MEQQFKDIINIQPLTLNLDTGEIFIETTEAQFLKNTRSTQNQGGNNAGNNSKLQGAKKLCDINLQGTNKVIGTVESQETSEVFVAVWNSTNQHSVYRIKKDHTCETVITDPCLNFQLDPKYSLNNRMKVIVQRNNDGEVERTILVMTEGYNDQFWINVETAIATNGYKDIAYDWECCEYLKYPVTQPNLCPQIASVEVVEDDNKNDVNKLKNRLIQFAYKFIYCDGRSSELSQYSVPFYISEAGCVSSAEEQANCLDLTIDAGNPLVKHIEIYQRDCGKDWYQIETLTDGCNNDCETEGKWSDYNYDAERNRITYRYCGDTQCVLGDQETLNRFQNDIPRKSFALELVGDAVALGNNLRDYNNLNCDTYKDKIEISVEDTTVSQNDSCQTVAYKTIRVAMYHDRINYNEERGRYYFGWERFKNQGMDEEDGNTVRGFEFPKGASGFLGGLRGTNYVGRGKQYFIAGFDELNVSDPKSPAEERVRGTKTWDANWISVWEFTVPAGRYVFEVYAHDATADYVGTSTFVTGSVGGWRCEKPFPWANEACNHISSNSQKEVHIDVCENDYDYREKQAALMFAELGYYDYTGATGAQTWYPYTKLIYGYAKDANGVPIANQYYNDANVIPSTDHNGFFFQFGVHSDIPSVISELTQVAVGYVKNDCTSTSKNTDTVSASPGMHRADIEITDAQQNTHRGVIQDCEQNGIGGVTVIHTHFGIPTTTDKDGNYEFLIPSAEFPTETLTTNTTEFVVPYAGICKVSKCNCECNSGLDTSLDTCPSDDDVVLDTMYLEINEVGGSTLKSNGKYEVGFALHDCFGRPTFVQNVGSIEIPDNLINGDKGDFSNFRIRVNAQSFNVPTHFKKLTWFVTENLSHQDYLQWIGGVSVYESNDDENSVYEGDLCFSIKSLFEFSEDNAFNSNAVYQYQPGDVIRFLADDSNGLDQAFETAILGIDIEKGCVIFKENTKLKSMIGTCGVRVELIHPKDCASAKLYYEVCGHVDITNGETQFYNDLLPFWDTYYVNRSIPFDDDDCEETGAFFGFESSTVSDSWGDKDCKGLGRVLIESPKAKATWYRDEITRSDEFVSEGRINGLGTFRVTNRKNFKGQDWGGIVTMIAMRNILLAVCENDWFVATYNLNYAKLGDNGTLIANFEDTMSEPSAKVGMRYGCRYEDNNAISVGNGQVFWPDVKRKAVAQCDLKSATNIAAIKAQTYFTKKFKTILAHKVLTADVGLGLDIPIKGVKIKGTTLSMWELSSVYDMQYDEFILTMRPRRGLSTELHNFENTEREPRYGHQETLVFSARAEHWVRFSGFTPENYAPFRTSEKGDNILSFANGTPYAHNNTDNNEYNTFYTGIPQEQVLQVVAHNTKKAPGSVLTFQNIAIETSGSYFVDRVYTNEKNSNSWIPQAWFKKKENTLYAPFLRDASSYIVERKKNIFPSTLMDGKRIFGKFAVIRVVSIDELADYQEIGNIKIQFIDSELNLK